VALLDYVIDGRIVLLYDEDIIAEYDEVLHRDKFSFADERIQAVIDLVRSGLHLAPTMSGESFPDPDDRVFYEVALSKDGSYVVTGNQRHFPKTPIVVSPTEMMKIIRGNE
jgi:predicted nucleic acid-binding protein